MQTVVISGIPRENVGKKATKAVRAEGAVPCVIYGINEVVHFSAKPLDLRSLIYTPDFKLAEVSVGGRTHKCIVKDKQFHPVTEQLLHIDFLILADGRKVIVEVPVRFKGTSPGVKVGGKLQQNVRRVKLKTTPENLVDEITVDISTLELGQSVRVRDIESIPNVEVMNSPGIPLATIVVPRALRGKQ